MASNPRKTRVTTPLRHPRANLRRKLSQQRKNLKNELKKWKILSKSFAHFLESRHRPRQKVTSFLVQFRVLLGNLRLLQQSTKRRVSGKQRTEGCSQGSNEGQTKKCYWRFPAIFGDKNPDHLHLRLREEDCQSLLCQSLLVSAVPLEVFLVERSTTPATWSHARSVAPGAPRPKGCWLSIYWFSWPFLFAA